MTHAQTSTMPAPDRASPASRLLDEHETVIYDVPCAGCEYSLRGLRAGDRCPECARACIDSLNPDMLRFSRPAVVRRLRFAGFAAAASLIVLVVTDVLMVFWMAYVPVTRDARLVAWLVMVLVYAVTLGIWLVFTLPEHDAAHDRETRPWRVMARTGIIWLFVARSLGVLIDYVLTPQQRSGAPTLRECLVMISGVLALTAMLLGCIVCLRRLAVRIPRPRLARRAGVLVATAWAFGIAGIINALWWIGVTMNWLDLTKPAVQQAASLIGIATGLVQLTFLVAVVAWLIAFSRAMGRVVDESRELHDSVRDRATPPMAPSV